MKKQIITIVILIVCSPFVSMAQAQQPPDGLDELSAYSIYYENFKNEQYDGAIRYGRWIYEAMPRQLKGYPQFNLEDNLDRLITAYTKVANSEQDPTLRSAYLDTAQIIYQKVFDEFNDNEINKFDWHLQYARFLQDNSDFIDNASTQAFEVYNELFNSDPKQFTQAGDGYYVEALLQNKISEGNKDQALKLIDTAEPYASQDVSKYFDQARNKLFDSPEERITFLEGQLADDPQNAEIMSELADLYKQQDMPQKERDMRQKLYEADPSYENTQALAEIAINNANYDTAIKYLKEAISKTDDNKQKAQIALDLSQAYQNKEDLQQSRSYAKQAANFNPSSGQPYLQIASIYSQAVNQCTSDRKMQKEDKVVYWLVLDYLDKAKQKDSSLANQVANQYKSYQPVTPTTEEKFFWQPPLKKGQKMKVDSSLNPCYDWINETTTVR